MSFTTLPFLVLVALSVAAYYLLPQRVQWMALLAASMVFYCVGGGKTVLYVFYTAVIVYGSGLLLGRFNDLRRAAPKEEKPSLWIECYTLLHDLVYILVFVTVLFVFALRVVSVSGPSMYPTLVDRDYVALLSNVFYSGSDIQNGDVVVALAPRFDDEPIVKRQAPQWP